MAEWLSCGIGEFENSPIIKNSGDATGLMRLDGGNFVVSFFYRDDFLRFVELRSSEENLPFDKKSVLALVEHAVRNENRNRDQVCQFLSERLPGIKFEDVIMFMTDERLSLGTSKKKHLVLGALVNESKRKDRLEDMGADAEKILCGQKQYDYITICEFRSEAMVAAGAPIKESEQRINLDSQIQSADNLRGQKYDGVKNRVVGSLERD